ncbi:phage portal protein [Prolixibacteraceae bacterium A06]|uniref:Phage portal protein n=1 Tax=Gaoshiqia sediminis TaxID=2986998 RepID=A0AA41Y760_9BACT|nr:phage portal protein [Gaoshiqia sediminis]MCW0484664.1 phage portal protein [Gaoshiqia sediminis]
MNGENILHFKTAIQDGYLGVSPLKSLIFEAGIRQKAALTIRNFYENNAMSPVVLSSNVSDLSKVKELKEFSEKFKLENAGADNAGKVIKLPPGMRLEALNYKLIDADIINTLKFTNQEIISAFGVPSFLMSYETTQSIENQTLEFKTFTLNSILAAYKNEIEVKMFTSSEIEQGYYIDFDYSTMLEADLTTKAAAYKELVTNGLITPNEAIKKIGLGMPINSKYGNLHYQQMQYIPTEERQTTLENK